MVYVNNNGTVCPSSKINISIDNRAFKYGDGVFESMVMYKGSLPLFALHYHRMVEGMKALRFDIPDFYTSDYFQSEINKLCEEGKNYRIRLSTYRSDGGLYTPISNVPKYLMEAKEIETDRFQLNEEGLRLTWYDEVPISTQSRLSGIKSANALTYVLAAIHKQTFGFDDALLFNDKGNVTEAISSNLFYIKNDILYTPHNDAGGVKGVMRNAIISISKALNIKVECPIDVQPKDIFEADGVFITNAVQGIRWVQSIDHAAINRHQYIDLLLEKLNDFKAVV